MILKIINKIALSTLLGLILFSSCTKDNSVTIVETEEELEVVFRMTVAGTEMESNAFAAYCETDTSSHFIIANRMENLTLPLNLWDFEEGDFVFTSSLIAGFNIPYGTLALGEEITGFPGLTISSSDAEINISTNDGQYIVGTSEGQLLSITDSSLYSYSMEFVAEIVQESDFCD